MKDWPLFLVDRKQWKYWGVAFAKQWYRTAVGQSGTKLLKTVVAVEDWERDAAGQFCYSTDQNG